jgi:broad specificity phosphatase PhoE
MRDSYTGTFGSVGILEVRRHSDRKATGGSQLSQEGIDRARQIGQKMGPFVKVVTSVVPRARETAIAMGFAVDHELVTLTADPGVYDDAARLGGAFTFTTFAKVLSEPGPWRDYAHSMAALWRDLMTPIGAGDDAVLFIGHSGEIEAALIACFPGADYATWGNQFGPCEGARLTFGGPSPECWRDVEFVRS